MPFSFCFLKLLKGALIEPYSENHKKELKRKISCATIARTDVNLSTFEANNFRSFRDFLRFAKIKFAK